MALTDDVDDADDTSLSAAMPDVAPIAENARVPRVAVTIELSLSLDESDPMTEPETEVPVPVPAPAPVPIPILVPSAHMSLPVTISAPRPPPATPLVPAAAPATVTAQSSSSIDPRLDDLIASGGAAASDSGGFALGALGSVAGSGGKGEIAPARGSGSDSNSDVDRERDSAQAGIDAYIGAG